MPEGTLTKTRSSIVCEPSLAYCAKELEIGKFILLGKGEEATGGRERDSITSDVMEALIGAIFLDSGLEEAKAFILRYILSDLENKRLFYDSKTVLQEMIQTNTNYVFSYELVGEQGPDHNKQFMVNAVLDGQIVGRGTGRTKKAAEQQAAYETILYLRNR